jgi:hypothetical protein
VFTYFVITKVPLLGGGLNPIFSVIVGWVSLPRVQPDLKKQGSRGRLSSFSCVLVYELHDGYLIQKDIFERNLV